MSLEPLPAVTHWLVRHAGFPTRRLEARAELALCVAALAAAAESAPSSAARGSSAAT